MRILLGCLVCLRWESRIVHAEASWVDPDTPGDEKIKQFVGDARQFDLVFSDEFDRCVALSWIICSSFSPYQSIELCIPDVYSAAVLSIVVQ